ncbi:MAG: pyruvate,water dikinase [Myxococcota bacterium]|jgi:pyruvate,water dikinase
MMHPTHLHLGICSLLAVLLLASACGDDAPTSDTVVADTVVDDTDDTAVDDSVVPPDTAITWECALEADGTADFLQQLGCRADFDVLASEPLDASIPGARSLKTVIDRVDGDALYFQNTKTYAIHWEFASNHLSGQGLPPVGDLFGFNQTEYSSPSRRFILGALTWYAEPGVWVYEISPYDTASAEMITTAYDAIQANTYVGADLLFHPTSQAVTEVAKSLPARVKLLTTEDLFAGITYQPLNLATSTGKLRFVRSADLTEGFLDFRDLVVLDNVPNDIGVVAGIITAALQTPLSHINVLSQNRGTPNMALLGALDDATLRALDGKWVELTVGAFDWQIREVTQAEAEAWWDANRPPAVAVPDINASVTDLRDIEAVLDVGDQTLGEALSAAIPAFGGKAAHYSALRRVTYASDDALLPVPKAFGIPIYYYLQHMQENGLDTQVTEMLADETFRGDATLRATRLNGLRDAIKGAPINADFLAAVTAKLNADYPATRVRFRSSTNAEDLDGFTGAGLYTSKSGDPSDPDRPVDEAIKKVWASIWNYKAYDERSYRNIDHTRVGMALLVHRSFPDEEANGVAITGNLFDAQQLEPAFIINVQKGEASVVLPDPGITTDYLIYYYYNAGQPAVFLAHSNLVADGTTVLTNAQTFQLGRALDAIHSYFFSTYGGRPGAFYGMDVEFKFDGEPGEEPALFVKQARPHPGWGL